MVRRLDQREQFQLVLDFVPSLPVLLSGMRDVILAEDESNGGPIRDGHINHVVPAPHTNQQTSRPQPAYFLYRVANGSPFRLYVLLNHDVEND